MRITTETRIEMKAADLKDLTVVELEDKLSDERAAVAKLKFNHTVSDLEDPAQIKHRRRDIARYLTELRQRELQQEKA